MRFPLLVKLMTGLMSIPSSNADSERGFFILRKIHTDKHPTLKQSTLISLKVLYHRQCQYTQANEYHFDGANSIETTNH